MKGKSIFAHAVFGFCSKESVVGKVSLSTKAPVLQRSVDMIMSVLNQETLYHLKIMIYCDILEILVSPFCFINKSFCVIVSNGNISPSQA